MLAKIINTQLGFEDHGILTSFLTLEYAYPGEKMGGAVQGFGGWAIKEEGASVWIKGVLKSVGVDEWGKLVGEMVWVEAGPSKVHAIRGLRTGTEFRPEEAFKQLREE